MLKKMSKRLVGTKRIEFLTQAAAEMPDGTCYVECGVWRGYSASKVGQVLNGKPMWLFDSFAGLPLPSDQDVSAWKRKPASDLPNYGMPTAADGLDLTRTIRSLVKHGIDVDTVNIIPGWFDDTFPLISPRVGPIGLLFLDCDWYASVKLSLETWWPKVVPGGIVVLDDYGAWQGCRDAVDEFLAKHIPKAELNHIDKTGVWMRKP